MRAKYKIIKETIGTSGFIISKQLTSFGNDLTELVNNAVVEYVDVDNDVLHSIAGSQKPEVVKYIELWYCNKIARLEDL